MPTNHRFSLVIVLITGALAAATATAESPRLPLLDAGITEFRVLATNKTSTFEKELNEAAAAGFVFQAMMGGDTQGGKELVAVMSKQPDENPPRRLEYKVLATNKTSKMERELQKMGAFGYRHRSQSVAKTTFGGREILVILERDLDDRSAQYDYRLLATTRTSTMQRELNDVAQQGYQLAGLTVAETAFGGAEVVAILSRR